MRRTSGRDRSPEQAQDATPAPGSPKFSVSRTHSKRSLHVSRSRNASRHSITAPGSTQAMPDVITGREGSFLRPIAVRPHAAKPGIPDTFSPTAAGALQVPVPSLSASAVDLPQGTITPDTDRQQGPVSTTRSAVQATADAPQYPAAWRKAGAEVGSVSRSVRFLQELTKLRDPEMDAADKPCLGIGASSRVSQRRRSLDAQGSHSESCRPMTASSFRTSAHISSGPSPANAPKPAARSGDATSSSGVQVSVTDSGCVAPSFRRRITTIVEAQGSRSESETTDHSDAGHSDADLGRLGSACSARRGASSARAAATAAAHQRRRSIDNAQLSQSGSNRPSSSAASSSHAALLDSYLAGVSGFGSAFSSNSGPETGAGHPHADPSRVSLSSTSNCLLVSHARAAASAASRVPPVVSFLHGPLAMGGSPSGRGERDPAAEALLTSMGTVVSRDSHSRTRSSMTLPGAAPSFGRSQGPSSVPVPPHEVRPEQGGAQQRCQQYLEAVHLLHESCQRPTTAAAASPTSGPTPGQGADLAFKPKRSSASMTAMPGVSFRLPSSSSKGADLWASPAASDRERSPRCAGADRSPSFTIAAEGMNRGGDGGGSAVALSRAPSRKFSMVKPKRPNSQVLPLPVPSSPTHSAGGSSQHGSMWSSLGAGGGSGAGHGRIQVILPRTVSGAISTELGDGTTAVSSPTSITLHAAGLSTLLPSQTLTLQPSGALGALAPTLRPSASVGSNLSSSTRGSGANAQNAGGRPISKAGSEGPGSDGFKHSSHLRASVDVAAAIELAAPGGAGAGHWRDRAAGADPAMLPQPRLHLQNTPSKHLLHQLLAKKSRRGSGGPPPAPAEPASALLRVSVPLIPTPQGLGARLAAQGDAWAFDNFDKRREELGCAASEVKGAALAADTKAGKEEQGTVPKTKKGLKVAMAHWADKLSHLFQRSQ